MQPQKETESTGALVLLFFSTLLLLEAVVLIIITRLALFSLMRNPVETALGASFMTIFPIIFGTPGAVLALVFSIISYKNKVKPGYKKVMTISLSALVGFGISLGLVGLIYFLHELRLW